MLEVIVWTSSVWAVIVPYTNKFEEVTLPFTFTDPDWLNEPVNTIVSTLAVIAVPVLPETLTEPVTFVVP